MNQWYCQIAHSRYARRALSLVPILVLVTVMTGLVGCESARAQRQQGVRAYNQGNYGAANQHLQKASDMEPTDFRNQYMLGINDLKQGKPKAAQLAFERALELKPNNPRWTPKARNALAESLYRQKRYDALHSFLAQTASQVGTPQAYLREARYLVRTGDHDAAARAYTKAAQASNPGDPAAYVAMADYYASINDVSRAIQALRYALYVDPDNDAVVQRLRKYGIIPGPTAARKPPNPQGGPQGS